MDKFGVPTKINRHVLKALFNMKDSGVEKPKFSDIYEVVEQTMKNNVPVRDLPSVLRQSLYNMAELGLVNIMGSNRFSINNTDILPPKSKRIYSKVNSKANDDHDREQELITTKSKRKTSSSQSEGKTPKRYRLDKTARIKVHNYALFAPEMQQRLELNEHKGRAIYFNNEFGGSEEEVRDSSLNTAVKDQFIEELSSVEPRELQGKQIQQEENNKELQQENLSNDISSPKLPSLNSLNPPTSTIEPKSEEINTEELKVDEMSTIDN